MFKKFKHVAITTTLIGSLLGNTISYVCAYDTVFEDKFEERDDIFTFEIGEFDAEGRVYVSIEEFNRIINNDEEKAKQKNAEAKADEETKRLSMYDDYIEEYCGYFNMNSTFVKDLARAYTEDYTISEGFTINGKEVSINDPEFFAMAVVYNIYTNYKDYDLTRDDIIVNNDVLFLDYNEEEIILSNGETFNNYLGVICDKVGVDKSLVLAIAEYETGYLTSYQAQNKNNFGGLKGGSGYLTYPTPEAGIIALVLTVDKLMSSYNIDNLNQLSGIYVNGNMGNPSSHWVGCVSSIQTDINDNEEEVFTYTLKKESL